MADHPLFSRHTAPVDKIIDNFPTTNPPRPRVPPTAPTPTYGTGATQPRKEKGESPLGRLVKFVRGEYTK